MPKSVQLLLAFWFKGGQLLPHHREVLAQWFAIDEGMYLEEL